MDKEKGRNVRRKGREGRPSACWAPPLSHPLPTAHPFEKPVRPAQRDKTLSLQPRNKALRGPGWALPHWQRLMFDLGQGSQNSCKPRGGVYNIP